MLHRLRLRGRLSHVAQAQGDAPLFGLDLCNPHLDLLADLDHVIGFGDPEVGELANVNETVDAGLQLDEGTESSEAGHGPLDEAALLVLLRRVLPGIRHHLLQAKGDLALLPVQAQDLDRDRLAFLDHLIRVLDAPVGHLGDVEQAVDAAQVDEGAEVRQALNHALTHLALLHAGPEVGLRPLPVLIQHLTPAENDAVLLPLHLDDLDPDGLAHVLRQVVNVAALDLRGRQEGPQAQVDHQAALDRLRHRRLDDLAGLLPALGLLPGADLVGPPLGQAQAALVAVDAQDHHPDLVAHLDQALHRVCAAVRHLVQGDDPFGLISDVDHHRVGFDPDDLARDDFALFEDLQGCLELSSLVFSLLIRFGGAAVQLLFKVLHG